MKLDKPLEINQIWNVNFPSCRLKDCKGILKGRTVSTDEFYKEKMNHTHQSIKRMRTK